MTSAVSWVMEEPFQMQLTAAKGPCCRAGPACNALYLVRLGRLERPTHGLEGRCSILLSYRRESPKTLIILTIHGYLSMVRVFMPPDLTIRLLSDIYYNCNTIRVSLYLKRTVN